jgi:hypothetical protein
MAKKTFNQKATNPFDDSPLTPAEADEALYGTVEINGKSSRVIIYPTDITNFRADVTQPRRTVPPSLRGGWDGTSEKVSMLLSAWNNLANQESNQWIKPADYFSGEMDTIEYDEKEHPITANFMDLLKLGRSIQQQGLKHPIQASEIDGAIESGERRWLAYHLLGMYGKNPDEWQKIPAVRTPELDVWAQAATNGAQRDLNKIESARQLALLIMDMYKDEFEFKTYSEIINDGGSDRDFYAQVIEGNTFPVKRGRTKDILAVTGWSGRANVQQYRDLLNLDSETWAIADEENWSLRACQQVIHPDWFVEKEEEVSNAFDTSQQNTPPVDPNQLQSGQGYATQYQPSNPPTPSGMDAIPDGGEQIKIGQFRVRAEGEDLPYIEVVREYDRGDWAVNMHDASGMSERTISGVAIYKFFPVVLDYTPKPPTTSDIVQGQPTPTVDTTSTNEAIKSQAQVDLMGYGDTEYPEGDPVTFEPGRRPTHYPESTPQDDDWDQEPVQKRGDGSEHIPMATAHTENLDTWLKHLQMMCRALDYGSQHDTFREMGAMTPARIKQLHQEGGDKAVQKLISAYGGAIDDMVNQLYFEAGTMLKMISAITDVPMPQVGEADDGKET